MGPGQVASSDQGVPQGPEGPQDQLNLPDLGAQEGRVDSGEHLEDR